MKIYVVYTLNKDELSFSKIIDVCFSLDDAVQSLLEEASDIKCDKNGLAIDWDGNNHGDYKKLVKKIKKDMKMEVFLSYPDPILIKEVEKKYTRWEISQEMLTKYLINHTSFFTSEAGQNGFPSSKDSPLEEWVEMLPEYIYDIIRYQKGESVYIQKFKHFKISVEGDLEHIYLWNIPKGHTIRRYNIEKKPPGIDEMIPSYVFK